MSGTKFSNEEIETMRNNLNSIQLRDCCPNPKKEILPELFQVPMVSNQMPTPGLDTAVIACHNCGTIVQVSPYALGIDPPQ